MNTAANQTSTYRLVTAFVIVFFAIGVPYWQIPYFGISSRAVSMETTSCAS